VLEAIQLAQMAGLFGGYYALVDEGAVRGRTGLALRPFRAEVARLHEAGLVSILEKPDGGLKLGAIDLPTPKPRSTEPAFRRLHLPRQQRSVGDLWDPEDLG